MDIVSEWLNIRNHFNQSFKTSLSVSIASVDQNNRPTIAPIGTLFLNSDQTGFYFEKYSTKLAQNATANNNICVLGVNSGKWFWIKALYKMEFKQHPAVRLYGVLGEKRKATEREMSKLNRRMKLTKSLKGNAYLWGDMTYVRDILFTSAEGVNIGKLTEHL